jgi:hypothetical protein
MLVSITVANLAAVAVSDRAQFRQLVLDPALSSRIQNLLVDELAAASLEQKAALVSALFDLVPGVLSNGASKRRDVASIPSFVERLRRANAHSPIYGGVFLPFLEKIADETNPEMRDAYRKALLKMLEETGKRSVFAATALAGIVGFQDYLIARRAP